MNYLAACSNILYDREVIEKNKEIFELQNRIQELEEKYEMPNIKSKYNDIVNKNKWNEDFDEKLRILLRIFNNNYSDLDLTGYNIGYDTNFYNIIKLFEDKFTELTDKTSSKWSKP